MKQYFIPTVDDFKNNYLGNTVCVQYYPRKRGQEFATIIVCGDGQYGWKLETTTSNARGVFRMLTRSIITIQMLRRMMFNRVKLEG